MVVIFIFPFSFVVLVDDFMLTQSFGGPETPPVFLKNPPLDNIESLRKFGAPSLSAGFSKIDESVYCFA